jgi:ribonuclease T2
LSLNRTGLIAAAGLLAIAAAYNLSGMRPLAPAGQAPVTASGSDTEAAPASDGDFDFYVLALSWSPSYCASKGRNADPQQCGIAKPPGFTAHGLWPQFERGSPQDCDIASRNVSREILRMIDPVMPSDGLARHEWQKHGTCSGLSQADYFNTLAQAVKAVRIPDMFTLPASSRRIAPSLVEAEFLKANPGMSAKGFAAVCGGGYLSEVRICMTKQLNFRECLEVDRKACRASTVEMPPAR